MSQKFAVEVKNLRKTFKLPHEKQSSIKGALISRLKGGRRTYELQEVLKDVSFTINKGEFFGIVGRNGSGKSTLLKLLAGTYSPTAGSVQVNGTLTPFIELGVGFNPELTGRENVFLNGSLLGFNRSDMEKMYEDIVSFAELERFMDQKLKNYSSGMQVRLAFSIAIRAQSDILLLDEVLAVGDEAFQRKCYEYFEDLKRNKKTVILVTHDMAAVEDFCDEAILIESGEIVEQGGAQKVALAYKKLFNPNIEAEVVAEEAEGASVDEAPSRWGDKRLSIEKPTVVVAEPGVLNSDIVINATVKCESPVEGPAIVAYAVKNSADQKPIGGKKESLAFAELDPGQDVRISFTFPNVLSEDEYSVDLSLYDVKSGTFIDCWIDCASFRTETVGVSGYPVIVDDRFNISS